LGIFLVSASVSMRSMRGAPLERTSSSSLRWPNRKAVAVNRPFPNDPRNPFQRWPLEESLLDQSKARPSADRDWEAILAKSTRSASPAAKVVYDTSTYLARVREEDPWPEETVPVSKGIVKIVSCRILTPAPVPLSKELEIQVQVDVTDELVGDDRILEVQLYDMYREPDADTCGAVGAPVSLNLKTGMGQSLKVQVRHPGVKDPLMHRAETHVFLRAEAIHRPSKQVVVSDPVPAAYKKPSALRVRLTGLVFDANKCFLLPESLEAMREVVAQQRKSPRGRILVMGHSESDEDLAGPNLAMDRAKAVSALLTNRWSQWLPWFAPDVPTRQRWGIREVQLMLGNLGHYIGNAAGVMDEPTELALREFQKSKGLTESGKVDSSTRKNLLSAYFGQPGTSLPQGVEPLAVGAQGLSDPDGTADPRCLEVLVWTEDAPHSPENGSMASADDCKEWRTALRETIEFPIDGLHFHLVNGQGAPMAGGKVVLSGPSSHEAVADPHGWVTVRGLAAGTYRSQTVTPDGRKLPMSEIVYPTAKTVTHEAKREAKSGLEPAAEPDPSIAASEPSSDTNPVDPPSDGWTLDLSDAHFFHDSDVPCFHSEGFLEALSGWAQDADAPRCKPVWQGQVQAHWEKRAQWLVSLVQGDDKSWAELAKGAGVRGKQSVLACLGAHGWPCDPGKVDGAAGPRTFNGIVQFQNAFNEAFGAGLVVDGQFGPKSWKAAFIALRHLIGHPVATKGA